MEIGTLSTFFSMEANQLGRARVEHTEQERDEEGTGAIARCVVHYPEGDIGVEERVNLDHASGTRTLALTALSDVWLMDVVHRMVFSLSDVRMIRIGGEVIPHARRNRYHQRPMCPVSVTMQEGVTLRLEGRAAGGPAGMDPVVYVRDEPGLWIVHFRLLATRPERVVLKGCHRLYNRPFPGWIQGAARRAPSLLRKALYVRERVSQRIPFQANGAVMVPKGHEARLTTRWEWT